MGLFKSKPAREGDRQKGSKENSEGSDGRYGNAGKNYDTKTEENVKNTFYYQYETC